MKANRPWTFVLISIAYCLTISLSAFAQSPEISLREFASGQIKKGVRSLGMGGNGATWGNYAMVGQDSSTALINAGNTTYSNGNAFSFTALGVTTPRLSHGFTVFILALSQYATDIRTSLKSPGLGTGSVPVKGDGSNQGVFARMAVPLGKNVSFGLLLSYERAQFSAISDDGAANYVRYKTNWLPSGGLGITWQPNRRLLLGFRALFNHDQEQREDQAGVSTGLNLAHEYRLGISIGLWNGALIDIGGNIRRRYDQINNTRSVDPTPNIGFEQNFLNRRFALRGGLDESSGTGGFSIRYRRFVLVGAYVHNLGMARIKKLYGESSNSLIATLTYKYGNIKGVKK